MRIIGNEIGIGWLLNESHTIAVIRNHQHNVDDEIKEVFIMSDTPISESLHLLPATESRQRGPSFSFLIRHYPHIQGLVIAVILLISTFSETPYLTLGAIGLYLVYYYGKRVFRKRKTVLGIHYKSETIQFIRSVVLILGVFAFLFLYYGSTDTLQNYYKSDTLWLLFLMPTFILSQRGTTRLLPFAVICSCFALFLLYLVSFPLHDIKFYFSILTKMLWLFLLSFLLNVLIQYIKDWYENFRLLDDIEDQIINIRTIKDEKNLLQRIVDQFASKFKYPHVNIFKLSGGVLKCVASADPGGVSLVMSGFNLDLDKGIVGYVAREGKRYWSNNVDVDQFYFKHPVYKKTNAELAVPIKVRGQIYGVIDIQSHNKDVFFDQDIEVADTLGRQLGNIIDNIQLHESNERISNITESIAKRFLSQHELDKVLDDIAEAALDEFNADFVVLYEGNFKQSNLIASAYKGHLKYYQTPQIHPKSGSLVHKIYYSKEDYFDKNIEDVIATNRLVSENIGDQDQIFSDFEGINSRVIIHLSTDLDCLGLLFINFRRSNLFDEIEKRRFYTFANLAALALEKSKTYRHQMQIERQRLASDLHDCLQSTANGVYKLLDDSLKEGAISNRQLSNLTDSIQGVQSIQCDVKFLISVLKESSQEEHFDNLLSEIKIAVQRAKAAYNIDIHTNYVGDHKVSPAITYQIKAILNEAFFNSIRHGEANSISLDICIDEVYISITIEDDGDGFDLENIKPGGLQNINRRTERYGGFCEIQSELGRGTFIKVVLPVE